MSNTTELLEIETKLDNFRKEIFIKLNQKENTIDENKSQISLEIIEIEDTKRLRYNLQPQNYDYIDKLIEKENTQKRNSLTFSKNSKENNYQTNFSKFNCSTELTKNYESDKINFNYIELGNSIEENYHDEEFMDTSIIKSHRDKKLNYRNEKSFSEKKTKENDNFENINVDNEIRNETNVIKLDDKFTIMNFNENENFYHENLIKNDENEVNFNRKIWKISNFIKEVLYIILILIMILIDPLIIIFLKFLDLFKNKQENENQENIYERNIDCLENSENRNSLYEKYRNYFLNNFVYKKHCKIIKIICIGILLLMNIIILATIHSKTLKVLFFMLNNLYLLYHSLDIYNERLIGYSENIKWNNVLNEIEKN